MLIPKLGYSDFCLGVQNSEFYFYGFGGKNGYFFFFFFFFVGGGGGGGGGYLPFAGIFLVGSLSKLTIFVGSTKILRIRTGLEPSVELIVVYLVLTVLFLQCIRSMPLK